MNNAFRRCSGIQKHAYLVLDYLFSDKNRSECFIEFENTLQTLLVRTWLPETPAHESAALTEEMEVLRRRQIAFIGQDVFNPNTMKIENISILLERARQEQREGKLTPWEQGNLRIMENHFLYLSSFRVDSTLTDRYFSTLTQSVTTWGSSLESITPWPLQKQAVKDCFEVLRESMKEPARILTERYGRSVSLSEAALMQLNPGVSSSMVDETLAYLKPRYRKTMDTLRLRRNGDVRLLPLPEIPIPVQMRIFQKIHQALLEGAGYNQERLDKSGVKTHFTVGKTGVCWGHSKDIVLCVESDPDDLSKGLNNIWHETGHMLYLLAMNDLPEEVRGKAVATFNGFGAHETAAMFMEQAGLRREAFRLSHPLILEELTKAKQKRELNEDFDLSSPALKKDNLYRISNSADLNTFEWGSSELALAPNMSWRINAFRKIFDGSLDVEDLPRFWSHEMEEWTGVAHDPENFMIGENHIFSGLGGYFWSYMTGAFTATAMHVQLAQKQSKRPTRVPETLASYSAMYSNVLKKNLFQHGSKDAPQTLLRKAAGLDVYHRHVIDSYLSQIENISSAAFAEFSAINITATENPPCSSKGELSITTPHWVW